MTTYSFTQTANGMIEAVVTSAHGIAFFPRKVFPPSRIREIRMAQNSDPSVIIDVDATAGNDFDYQIVPATDRLTLGTAVYQPGDLTPDALLDVLKASVVFQKANSGSGGSGTMLKSSFDNTTQWYETLNNSGAVVTVKVTDNYADDAAAAEGGIELNDFYHTGGTIKQRTV